MAYVTQADLERAAGALDRLIELTDRDGDGAVDDAVLAEKIAEVEDAINGYIEPRHPVPLDEPIPTSLRLVVAREVIYSLLVDRRAITDRVQEQHEADIEWLDKVAAGRVGLGLTRAAKDRTPASAEVGDRSDVGGAITRASLEGFS